VNDDRIRAKPPTHDSDDWREGTIESMTDTGGVCVVTVRPSGAVHDERRIELRVTLAIRDLFVGRLDGDPVGARVWFQKRGE
jgi:hypothetical protein